MPDKPRTIGSRQSSPPVVPKKVQKAGEQVVNPFMDEIDLFEYKPNQSHLDQMAQQYRKDKGLMF